MMLVGCPSMSVEENARGMLEEAGPKWRRSIEREKENLSYIFAIFLLISKVEIFDWSRAHLQISARDQLQRGENSGILKIEMLPRFACQTPGSSFSRFPAPVGARFRKYTIYISKRSERSPERGSEVYFV